MNRLTISTAAGTDPDEIDVEDRNIPSRAYGENVVELFPEIDVDCEHAYPVNAHKC